MVDPASVNYECPDCGVHLSTHGKARYGYWKCKSSKCGNNVLYVEKED